MGNLIFSGYFSADKKDKQTAEISFYHMVCMHGVLCVVRKIVWVVENASHSFDVCAFVLAFLSDSLLAEFFLCYAKLLSAVCHGLFGFFDVRWADI